MNPRNATAAALMSVLRERRLGIELLAAELGVALPVMRRVASGDTAVRFEDFKKIRLWVESQTNLPPLPRIGRPVGSKTRPKTPDDEPKRATEEPKLRLELQVQQLRDHVKHLEDEIGIIKARLFYPETQEPICSP